MTTNQQSLQERARSGEEVSSCISGNAKDVRELLNDLAAALDAKDADFKASQERVTFLEQRLKFNSETFDALLAEAMTALEQIASEIRWNTIKIDGPGAELGLAIVSAMQTIARTAFIRLKAAGNKISDNINSES